MRARLPDVLVNAAGVAALTAVILASGLLQAQDREYLVDGKPVPEPVYRSATLVNAALPLIEANRFEEAKAKLVQAVDLAPDFPLAHYNLGVVLMKLGNEDAAAAQFSAVVAARAELPEAWVSLAAVHYNKGRYDEAIAILNDAAASFPAWRRVPEFYSNLGLALARVGRTAEAIEQLKLALAAEPHRPAMWLNVASLYQETGKLNDSIAHYKEFLRRSPADPDAGVIADTIKNIEGELRAAASRSSTANAADYYVAATEGRPKTWPKRTMPLRVYIHGGEGAVGFHERYREILKAAFGEWSRASDGAVKFQFTDRIREAQIECLWTGDPNQLKNRSEGGETHVYFRADGGIYDAQILILTVPISRTTVVTDRSIRLIALHEIGHALGMFGHSGDPDDIMYFSIPVTEKTRELSPRDRKTLGRLYGPK
jgi:tetratricopeptide (TPR) repeat protein